MKRIALITTSLFALFFVVINGLNAQPWSFVKEKDGIKVYTRTEANSPLKSFKGDVIFNAPIEKVCDMLGNAKNMDWWNKEITDIRVLGFEENKFIKYYMVYNVPWPITSRDLVAETIITSDPATGDKIFDAKPLPNTVPEKLNLIRIRNFRQVWTVKQMDKGNVHVFLEGYIDPGGNIPAWFYNLVVAETPLRAIQSLRERVLSDKPANK